METHLNLAHRSHRKAEYYTKCHQFSEAISHYKKASEYLEKAILNTHCDTIRSSLIIQRIFCLEQIEFLQRRLCNATQKDQVKLSGDHSKPVEDTQQDFKMTLKELEQKYKELYNVMNQQDSLLNCLYDKESPSSSRSSPTSDSIKFKAGNRKPKIDKEIIEELKTINDKLRQWVRNLVDNLENAQLEIQTLKEENSQLRKDLIASKQSNQDNEKNVPQLPSLDPPVLFY